MRWNPEKIYDVYLIALFISTIGPIFKLKYFDHRARAIFCLLAITFFSEIAATITLYFGLGKNIVYHFFNVIELTLMTYYFLKTVRVKKACRFTLVFGITYSLIAFLNEQLFQPLKTLNSNFIALESFLVISMSLYALYNILKSDVLQVTKQPHFWLWVILLFYFSCTFFFWPFVKIIYKEKPTYYSVIASLQVIANIITYIGIGIVLAIYPKIKSL